MIGTLILLMLYVCLVYSTYISFNFYTINTQDTLDLLQKLGTPYKQAGLLFTGIPSVRLKKILEKNNIANYKYILEFEPDNKINLPIKQTLNSLASVYLCINLVNGQIYVGSASKNGMYRRYSSLRREGSPLK